MLPSGRVKNFPPASGAASVLAGQLDGLAADAVDVNVGDPVAISRQRHFGHSVMKVRC